MGQIKTPQQVMYEARVDELLKELNGLCPSFLLVTANSTVDSAIIAFRGSAWANILPKLLRKQPEIKKALTAAVLQAHLMPDSPTIPGLN